MLPHEIMESWEAGRFKDFVDGVIEKMSKSAYPEPLYAKFHDLLLEIAWTSRRVADLDERLAARFYGLSVEAELEMLRIMKTK
jgi:hypothetical protein